MLWCGNCRYFLPPIIFYAGLSVKKKKFFRNFPSIALLGIVGTWILFGVIAAGLFAISKLPNLLNLTVRVFLFGPSPNSSAVIAERHVSGFCVPRRGSWLPGGLAHVQRESVDL